MNKTIILSTILALFFLVSCGGNGYDDDDTISLSADSFATAYFNYDFEAAARHATPETEKCLRFAASNVIEDDIEILRSQDEGAAVESGDVNRTSDSTAVLRCKVTNFLKRDTLGRPGHMVSKAYCTFGLVLRGSKWLVDVSSISFDKD